MTSVAVGELAYLLDPRAVEDSQSPLEMDGAGEPQDLRVEMGSSPRPPTPPPPARRIGASISPYQSNRSAPPREAQRGTCRDPRRKRTATCLFAARSLARRDRGISARPWSSTGTIRTAVSKSPFKTNGWSLGMTARRSSPELVLRARFGQDFYEALKPIADEGASPWCLCRLLLFS